MSPGTTVGVVMLICLVVGYLIGAYLMRRHMLNRIKQITEAEVADAMRRYERGPHKPVTRCFQTCGDNQESITGMNRTPCPLSIEKRIGSHGTGEVVG